MLIVLVLYFTPVHVHVFDVIFRARKFKKCILCRPIDVAVYYDYIRLHTKFD